MGQESDKPQWSRFEIIAGRCLFVAGFLGSFALIGGPDNPHSPWLNIVGFLALFLCFPGMVWLGQAIDRRAGRRQERRGLAHPAPHAEAAEPQDAPWDEVSAEPRDKPSANDPPAG